VEDEVPTRRSRASERLVDDDVPARRERVRDVAPPLDDEPRYRATAPAPRYIPSPSLAADDLLGPDDDLAPVDDTPTLVDLGARRAMRDAVRERDAAREAAIKSRRTRRRQSRDKDDVDEEYWGYLRGEAQ
jgi:hypothetical protein